MSEDLPEMESEQESTPPVAGARAWMPAVWFLLGVAVGVAGLAALLTLGSKNNPLTAAMRQAARDGTLDAIATLEAGGPAPQAQAPQQGQAPSFTIREANQAGNKAARVTVVEFSDFQ